MVWKGVTKISFSPPFPYLLGTFKTKMGGRYSFTAVKRVKFAKVKRNTSSYKIATFTIESLRYYQHPVSLLNFFKVY